MKVRSIQRCAFSWLLLAAGNLIGCSGFRAVPGEVRFSPDASIVAYTWLEQLREPWLDGETLRHVVHVEWRSTGQSPSYKSVRLGSLGADWRGYHTPPVALAFSPDSRRLAVVMPWRLSLIDLESGAREYLNSSDEIVTSFTWLDDDEIGYVTRVWRKGKRGITDRTFWRQKLNDAPGRRVAIYQDRGVELATDLFPHFDWPQEHWAPDGKHVLCWTRDYDKGDVKVLAVRSGTVSASWASQPAPDQVTWRPDGSAVLLVWDVTRSSDHRVVLYRPVSGQVQYLSERFAAIYGEDPALITVAWAYGGQRVLAWYSVRTAPDESATGPGGYEHHAVSIRLDPWQVTDIGGVIRERLGSEVWWDFHPHLLGGCLVTWGRQADGVLRTYAVNATGSTFWQLRYEDGTSALSPDGRLLATIAKRKQLRITELALPTGFDLAQPAGDTAQGAE